MTAYHAVFEQALSRGRRLHPGAPEEHHVAFANAVMYGVTCHDGSFYEGPSMRERRARWVLWREGVVPGSALRFDSGRAASLVDRVCYGPLTPEIASTLFYPCFGDAPGEVARARDMLNRAKLAKAQS